MSAGTLVKLAKQRRRWLGRGLLYLGDYRLRLLNVHWAWHGLNDRRWYVSFQRGPASGSAIHCRFTAALAIAIYNTYADAMRGLR